MLIPLTQGKYAIVDDDAPVEVTGVRWYFNSGYARRHVWVGGKGVKKYYTLFLHRILVQAPPGMEVDHINHDKLDNRRCNLRICTPGQNKQNSPKSSKPKRSKYKGPQKRGHTWKSQIFKNRKQYYLGTFNTEEEAAKAYNRAAIELFGEFANLNPV